MRGEHAGGGVHVIECWGSSPHARGTLEVWAGGFLRIGIIPACAGNTRSPVMATGDVSDHPRMRGEHAGVTAPSATLAGSSPHARGTPTLMASVYPWAGIIPACAGNTRAGSRCRSREWDHPRMRGEH